LVTVRLSYCKTAVSFEFCKVSLIITWILFFNSSALGIQEMGIPEAITHAIEQLPTGESLK